VSHDVGAKLAPTVGHAVRFAKMYGVPSTGSAWLAVGARLARGVSAVIGAEPQIARKSLRKQHYKQSLIGSDLRGFTEGVRLVNLHP
jgi:hypothetical protein